MCCQRKFSVGCILLILSQILTPISPAPYLNIAAQSGDTVTLLCGLFTNGPIAAVVVKKLGEEEYVLFCRDDSCEPDYQIPSFRGRVEVRVKNNTVTVIIKNVTSNDSGLYKCHISNGTMGPNPNSPYGTWPIKTFNLVVSDHSGHRKAPVVVNETDKDIKDGGKTTGEGVNGTNGNEDKGNKDGGNNTGWIVLTVFIFVVVVVAGGVWIFKKLTDRADVKAPVDEVNETPSYRSQNGGEVKLLSASGSGQQSV